MTANIFKLEKIQPVPQIPDVLPPRDTLSLPILQRICPLRCFIYSSAEQNTCTPEAG